MHLMRPLLLSLLVSCFLRMSVSFSRITLHRIRTSIRKLTDSNSLRMSATSLVDSMVSVRNTQVRVGIDKEKTVQTVREIQKILMVEDFAVDVWYCSDSKIRELNYDFRGIRKSTDVLSFPVCEFDKPGVFAQSEFLEGEKHLGDIVIAPTYVQRQCIRDKKTSEAGELDASEAGVSGAMASVFAVQDRFPYLLIHGILHLMGYDHETEEDWAVMTKKESEVMQALGLNTSTNRNT